MTTSAQFDAATFADALNKASRVAPNKGAAFDKAAGIMFIVTPGSPMVVYATDLDTTYRQEVPMLSCEGEAAVWRLPSALIAGTVASLPLGEGSVVKLANRGDNWVYVQSGEFTAKIATLRADDYPSLVNLDLSIPPMSAAQEFASKVAQVSWAVAKSAGSSLGGVYIDGSRLWATDKYVLASVPCEVPLPDPVVAPLFTLGGLLANATDVRLRANDRRLEMSLDQETTATSRLIDERYPDLAPLLRDEFFGEVEFSRSEFLERIDRILVLATGHAARLGLLIDGDSQQIVFDMDIDQVGRMRDSIPFTGDFTEKAELFFDPTRIRNAVDGSKARRIKVQFGKPDGLGELIPVIFIDEADYQCLVSQMRGFD
jgi:DNA polymerase III sliding clamp (beta) subunit (PCNA family)